MNAGPAVEHQLVDATEAYLAGRYASYLRRNGMAVPGWAWLNTLAHAPVEELARLAAPPEPRERLERALESPFERSGRILAAELLGLVGDDRGRLIDLQSRALIPLELDLITASFAHALDPDQLVDSFREALGSDLN
jgi:hypothetical protein